MASAKKIATSVAVKSLSALYSGVDDDLVDKGLVFASTMVRSPRTRKVLAWCSIGYGVGRRVWAFAENKMNQAENTYRILLEEDDDAFIHVQKMMANAVPNEDKRELFVERCFVGNKRSNPSASGLGVALDEILGVPEGEVNPVAKTDVDNAADENRENVSVVYLGTERVELEIAGHTVVAQYQPPRVESTSHENDSQVSSSSRYAEITVHCKTAEIREDVIDSFETFFRSTAGQRTPAVWQANSWGEVSRLYDAPKRSLDTVILKPGQIESLVGDIKRFLRDEELYVDMGMPYHRGILLYGMPGTGKTSIAAAAANALGLDIFLVTVSEVKTEKALKAILGSIPARSVLVLEEIDSCGAATDGATKDTGLSRDVLLQALDGFTAPHGLITIMTTNHYDRLDPALTRAGRVDLKLEIGAVNTEQITRLCQRFIGYVPDDLPDVREEDGIVPADIIEIFKQHLRTKHLAGSAVVEMLTVRLLENSFN